MKAYSRWRFALALLLAALFSNPLTIASYRRAWRAFKTLFGFIGKGERVSAEIEQRRREACERCPIFSPKLDTCGSPLAGNPELGCWCFMPAKIRLTGSECWLDQQSPAHNTGFGWNAAK